MRPVRDSFVAVSVGIAWFGSFASSAVQAQVLAQPAAAVEPGYLGVLADDLPDGAAGIRVLDVMADGPAQVAGLRPGDVITSIDGKTAAKVDDMAALLAGRPAGDAVTFVVRRGNDVTRIEVRLGRRPAPGERRFENFGRVEGQPGTNPTAAVPAQPPSIATPGAPVRPNPLPPETLPQPGDSPSPPTPAPPAALPPSLPAAAGGMLLGVRAVPVSPEIQKALSLPHARGSLIVEVRPGSPAQQAGIPLEAVITEIDGMRVDTPQALADAINTKGHGAVVKLSYYRFGQMQEKMLRLGGGPVAEPTPPVPVPPPSLPPSLTPAPPTTPAAETEADALRRQIRDLENRLKSLEQQPPAESKKSP